MAKQILVWALWVSCWAGDGQAQQHISWKDPPATAVIDTGQVILIFSFEINRSVYTKTNFGEPPQVAVWIESPDSSQIRTVWVSRRAGMNDWKGKVECPVALPLWESRLGLNPSSVNAQERRELFDGLTSATPSEGSFTISITVPYGGPWRCFIEVNASADYNKAFPYWSSEGLPDSQSNGQPSLVYSSVIKADGHSNDTPMLAGRTAQRGAVPSLSKDLEGITTAAQLLDNIAVRSRF